MLQSGDWLGRRGEVRHFISNRKTQAGVISGQRKAKVGLNQLI